MICIERWSRLFWTSSKLKNLLLMQLTNINDHPKQLETFRIEAVNFQQFYQHLVEILTPSSFDTKQEMIYFCLHYTSLETLPAQELKMEYFQNFLEIVDWLVTKEHKNYFHMNMKSLSNKKNSLWCTTGSLNIATINIRIYPNSVTICVWIIAAALLRTYDSALHACVTALASTPYYDVDDPSSVSDSLPACLYLCEE